ncbi:MAG: tetratricopeptide repeat protein [Polyangia bacterium]|jgi:tetratricopeptide (TPR) repeat protein|nr:tetratricopeptide repeat protein [Polyangia bacterium]
MKPASPCAFLAACLAFQLLGGQARGAAREGLDIEWLVKPAERAILGSEFAKAALLIQGAIAIRPADPELLWRLSEIYTMGGQFSLAQETYAEWLKVGKDSKRIERAKSEIARLSRAPAPFVEGEDNRAMARQPDFAMEAVKRAKALERRKLFKDAILYLQAALVLDSTLVGAYRLIGAMYGRLKDPASEQAFYVRYLRQVPGGKLASMVRGRLKAHPELGKVTLEASFPCMVLLNRGLLDERKRTPFKDVVLPAGEYTAVFYSAEKHFGQKSRVVVKPGQSQVVKAEFGALEIALEPWARVRAQRAGARGWRDLGLWDQVGLPVGRWKLEFKTDDGKKTMSKEIDLKPGAILKVNRWE